jgi:hypothetical protein
MKVVVKFEARSARRDLRLSSGGPVVCPAPILPHARTESHDRDTHLNASLVVHGTGHAVIIDPQAFPWLERPSDDRSPFATNKAPTAQELDKRVNSRDHFVGDILDFERVLGFELAARRERCAGEIDRHNANRCVRLWDEIDPFRDAGGTRNRRWRYLLRHAKATRLGLGQHVVVEEVDQRSDLYSLGVTLYETLAARPIPQGQYEELSLLNQAIPPQIDELVRACLQPRDRRLESAKQFATKLAGALLPSRPLSEVLGHGKLHEIAAALRDITADSFMRLPAGQRELVLVKLDDIVSSEDTNLEYAAASF